MADETTVEGETEVLEQLVSDEDAIKHLQDKGTPRLVSQMAVGVVTPIELARALEIRPQMVYNYIRNGRINAHQTEDTQKLVINLDDAQAFVRQRLNKQAAKAVEINNQLAGAAQAKP